MKTPPGDVFPEGLTDLAAKRRFKTLAVIGDSSIGLKVMAQGAVELGRKKGLQIVLVEDYAEGTTDVAAPIGRVRSANPDVIVAADHRGLIGYRIPSGIVDIATFG